MIVETKSVFGKFILLLKAHRLDDWDENNSLVGLFSIDNFYSSVFCSYSSCGKTRQVYRKILPLKSKTSVILTSHTDSFMKRSSLI